MDVAKPYPIDTKLGKVMWTRNVSITRLCEATGLHRNTISALLARKHNFTPRTLALCAAALTVEVEDLVD